MKLRSLISAVMLGMAVFVQAQTSPVPRTTKSIDRSGGDLSSGNRMEEVVNLPSGPLDKVVAEVQRHFKDSPTKPDVFLPNLVYANDTRDAVVPGELTLRRVTPMQALALVVAAADCALEPIFAPVEPAEGSTVVASVGVGQMQPIIGYRVARVSAPNRNRRIMNQEVEEAVRATPLLSGVGIALSKKDGSIVVGQVIPGSPASLVSTIQPGQRIVSVAEAGKEEMAVAGLALEKVVQLIRGTPGTPVKITFGADSDSGPTNHVVSLTRAKLPVLPSDGTPQVKMLDSDSSLLPPSGNDPFRNTTTMPADNKQRIVRVYSLGSVLSNSDKDEKERGCEELIALTLRQAELNSPKSPDLSFHPDLRVLVVKATAAQHEMIGQVIKALKESANQPATTSKP